MLSVVNMALPSRVLPAGCSPPLVGVERDVIDHAYAQRVVMRLLLLEAKLLCQPRKNEMHGNENLMRKRILFWDCIVSRKTMT